MRRKEQATPEPLPVDGARIRQLIAQAAADRDGGVNMHQHPALCELGELCGVLTYYRFQLEDPRTPAELEDFATRAIQGATPEDAEPAPIGRDSDEVVSLEERRRKRDYDATR